ncbi:carbamoyl phosphate synthase small subunit [Candidatus Gottesmanbacteria bacterium CG11_big_fil_rev_8_21_14_0_20_37_11]|uniref:Carbamoyl phosphate synthase small chain n=3 Tax=Candidatus Gottesmaniibacteriota TaxID=1752720 RepID=A0A2M7RSG4_9BACT|nr:MAG: carbamoyl phosphate synthase small subunit [Candidatus Gottesmanbacteria bacterium CG1_02_37_22]PIP32292.1 MAG: carbamoyl phosphate synthase small subunit [Candidatus Gottesmanbacteria bacterium CG23_combo_of_CG06-09_8_20_14_all_37_19]PIR07968.1 MAG: carbamoyl phosphate synthase small subunit [Candidatus Gottesmanbacteria bacterium CG11_big_fil_rev_8_21_14_0_20_37_11]PIZ03242.1 MAG: carbamoyl-phosphate synthase (glutamine-hydrolyzing) small subunit [Candidatus Gottesmanbacteria bacterium
MGKKGYLVLENGKIFEGISFGYKKEVSGEVVFNTGMVGYPESLTDPSYYGQILTFTYPLIGNYGVPPLTHKNNIFDYIESDKIQIRALIVSSYIANNSHWQSKEYFSSWLVSQKVPALDGIDTRTLTKILRTTGVMKGILTFNKPQNNEGLNFYDINKENLAPYVSCKKKMTYGNGKNRILFIDCGVKYNQIKELLKYDTTIIRVPWNYDPFRVLSNLDFDAVFISNGPGDPRNMPETVDTIKEAIKREIPIFGICLGHQLLSLAAGGEIFKLKYGHRGQNQPVVNQIDHKCYITSQNHGFAVSNEHIPPGWFNWFTNLNDDTNEGLHHKILPIFSVQFHPEAAPGPTDTDWLFKYFISKI